MSKKIVAYKYRMYPKEKQRILLAKTFGCVRYFWNNQVATFKSYNKKTNPKPKFLSSTELRHNRDWMREISAGAVQQKEKDFKKYRNQLFNKNRKKKLGFPSFKKKGNKESFRLPNQKFAIKNGKIRLEKIGWIRIVIDRNIPEYAKLLSVTIS